MRRTRLLDRQTAYRPGTYDGSADGHRRAQLRQPEAAPARSRLRAGERGEPAGTSPCRFPPRGTAARVSQNRRRVARPSPVCAAGDGSVAAKIIEKQLARRTIFTAPSSMTAARWRMIRSHVVSDLERMEPGPQFAASTEPCQEAADRQPA